MMKFINLRLVAAFLLFVGSSIAKAEDPYYFKVVAESGDGIQVLMQRYGLSEYQCNTELFCKLNDLNVGSQLILSREYSLPIKIYKYNGVSIRSTIGLDDYKKAMRIQKYNEDIYSKGLRKTDFRVSKILWVPYHEILGVTADEDLKQESTPSVVKQDRAEEPVYTKKVSKSGGLVVNKLFGKDYEDVELEDNSLDGHVYYISSGHGGPDPGAMCTNCDEPMCEDEYAYDVSLRLARNLTQHGATVHMIIEDRNDGIRDEAYLDCDHDELTVSGAKLPLRQLDRLKQRADAMNYLYAKHKKAGAKVQKAIMIHVDSRGEDKRQDVFFYHSAESKLGKELAETMKTTFEEKYEMYQKGRGYHGYVSERGLYMLRKTLPTAVYVELANIKNTEDHKRLIVPTNRQALANWLMEGLIK